MPAFRLFVMLLLLALPPCRVLAAAPSFAGRTIVVGVMDAPAIGGPALEHAKSWEKRTGGKVELRAYPYGELFAALHDGLEGRSPPFDVILYASAWVGDFEDHLQPLPDSITQGEDFLDLHATYRERLMVWEGQWKALTIDGDLFSGYYRRDLFEDPRHRADFLARHGRELAPPETWKQYQDIAAFFHGRTGPDGAALHGASEPYRKGGQAYWDLFSRVSAYANLPGTRGQQFFDPDTMDARLDNPAWLRATREYLTILRHSPPEARTFDVVESRQAFVQGRAALSLDWGDTAQLAADPASSAVAGKVGYFVLPGTEECWNAATRQWTAMHGVHKAPFLAFGGWVASVPVTARHPEAAWDFIQWYASPENSLADVVKSGTGVNPYRYSHLFTLDHWARAFSSRDATEFLAVIRKSLDSPNAALDLRILGYEEYIAVLETELAALVNGPGPDATDQHIQAALTRVAAAWNAITDRLGRPNQKRLYRAAMGLDN